MRSMNPKTYDNADRVFNLSPKDLRPSSINPRKSFDRDAMKELVDSVKMHGVIEPLIVRPTKDAKGKHEVVVGERRLRAAVEAGVKTVPVILKELTDEQALEVMIAENLMRDDLKPLEEAEAVKRFLDNGVTQQELAKRIGKSQAWISNRARMMALPENLQRLVAERKIGVEHAILAAPYADKAVVKKIARNFEDKLKMGAGMTVQEAQSQVENALNTKSLVFNFDDRYGHNEYKEHLDLDDCKKCKKKTKRTTTWGHAETICLEADCFRPRVKAAKEKAKEAAAKKIERKVRKGTLHIADMDRNTYAMLEDPRHGGDEPDFDHGACRKCDKRQEAIGHAKQKVVICVDRSCYNAKAEAFKEALQKRVVRLKANIVANLDARAAHQGTALLAAEKRLVLHALVQAEENTYYEDDVMAIAFKPWYQKAPKTGWEGVPFKLPETDLDEACFRLAAAYSLFAINTDAPNKTPIVRLLPELIRDPDGKVDGPAAPATKPKKAKSSRKKQVVVDDGAGDFEDEGGMELDPEED